MLAQFDDGVDDRAFLVERRLQRQLFIGVFIELGIQLGNQLLMVEAIVLFLLQTLDFKGQVFNRDLALLQSGRNRALAEVHPSTSGIQQADTLVGQLTAWNITMRQGHGTDDGFVQNHHAMVLLQRRRNAAQHHSGLIDRWLFHFHHLETAGQRGIGFEVFFVFRPGGGGNGTQFATGQCRFQQVGGIAGTRLITCTDRGVGFVNEDHHRFYRLVNFLDDVFQTVFELAFHTGTGLQQANIQRVNFNVLEGIRHVAAHNALGQTFHHGGFTHTGLTGQDRVVLFFAGQDINHLADLVIAANHPRQFAVTSHVVEVDGELIQRRGFGRRFWLAFGSRGLRFAVGQQTMTLLAEGLDINGQQAWRSVFQTQAQHIAFNHRQQNVHRANAEGFVTGRRHHPGFKQQTDDVWRDFREALAAGVQQLQRCQRFAVQLFHIDIKVLQHQTDIVGFVLGDFLQQVFNVGRRMATGSSRFNCAFQQATALVREVFDQLVQFHNASCLGSLWRPARFAGRRCFSGFDLSGEGSQCGPSDTLCWPHAIQAAISQFLLFRPSGHDRQTASARWFGPVAHRRPVLAVNRCGRGI